MLRNYKTSKKNRTNYINHSANGLAVDTDHKEDRVIFIGKEAIPVTEEVYQVYYKGRRRERYMQSDAKVGRIDVDIKNQKVTFVDSKEDSIERLSEQGISFQDEQSVEDIVCENAMLLLLNKAKEILDEEELKLINAVYDQELTYRQAGEILNISHVAVQKRHNKVLDKLRKYFL